MDDLKLLAPNATRLQELLNITNEFSDSGQVCFSACGEVTYTHFLRLNHTSTQALACLSLGESQSIGVQELDLKQSVCEVFFQRLTKIGKSFSSGANKARAYNRSPSSRTPLASSDGVRPNLTPWIEKSTQKFPHCRQSNPEPPTLKHSAHRCARVLNRLADRCGSDVQQLSYREDVLSR
ncbi:jg23669 [Pararge aegeria aegeria]|uniref:Jg23669 protein n=1 Tax=Pararge aegeria aegeria TaxID=348720 RepID=A0A8S4QSZ1_9NEOP|nr:jg23669 [Pararge aegeria aegeria]